MSLKLRNRKLRDVTFISPDSQKSCQVTMTEPRLSLKKISLIQFSEIIFSRKHNQQQ